MTKITHIITKADQASALSSDGCGRRVILVSHVHIAGQSEKQLPQRYSEEETPENEVPVSGQARTTAATLRSPTPYQMLDAYEGYERGP